MNSIMAFIRLVKVLTLLAAFIDVINSIGPSHLSCMTQKRFGCIPRYFKDFFWGS